MVLPVLRTKRLPQLGRITGVNFISGIPGRGLHTVPRLQDGGLDTFRTEAFNSQTPALLPLGQFIGLPATTKWFSPATGADEGATLNRHYLSQYGSTIVPLEIIQADKFVRIDHEFSTLLDFQRPQGFDSASVYLAQAPLKDLPRGLQRDLPTPSLVLEAGQGDVYDSSLWIGRAPTYTPLHRDPNPNLFVQLAGTKVIRMLDPDVGGALFAHVQAQIGASSCSPTMRGEEMMQGKEKEALEKAVWEDDVRHQSWLQNALECRVQSGDALFIPKGWWHSVKGIGPGIVGSVNWWFR